MSDPKEIWLAPECHEDGDGRTWCEHDVWSDCDGDSCHHLPVRYVLASDYEREVQALRLEIARWRVLASKDRDTEDSAIASCYAACSKRDALAAENQRLRSFESAYIEWQEKTEWVQADTKPKELGKHRADVLRERIEALSVNNRKSGFCGEPYVHDCGRFDCPTSDSYKG